MEKITKFLKNILFLFLIFIFAFIPLYPKFPLINIKGTFVAIRIEDFLIALIVVLWFLYLIFSNSLKSFLNNKLNQALLLFLFIGVVSTFSASFLTHSVVLHLSVLHFLRRAEFIILLPICISIITSKKRLLWILVCLALTILVVDIFALGQQYLDWPVISTSNSEFSKGLILRLTPGARVNSTFAGHYDLAVFLAMAITILSAIFFAVKKRIKIIIILLGILSLVVLIMTAARVSFVAAFVGVLVSLLLTNKKKYVLFIFIGLAAVLIYPSQLQERFISTVTVNLLHMGQRYSSQTQDQNARSKLNIPTLAIKTSSTSATASTFGRGTATTASDIAPGEPLDSTELGVYRSFEIRYKVEWPRAITAFIKNPLLGTGYSSVDIATDNDFLRSLAEVGLLGTISFILILIEIAKNLFAYIENESKFIKYFSAGIFSMLIAFLVNGLFIDVFEASKVASLFWMMLGLGLAVSKF